jgi:hypothetical protein
MSSAQRRLLESIGLQRVPRDVTPTLAEYLRLKSRVETAEAEDAEVEAA